MAFLDGTLQLSTAQAISATANSTLIYDVTGAGSGNAPAMTYGQGSNGFDIGNGKTVFAEFNVTTAGTGAGTISVAIQAAPDNGSNAPGTYVTLSTSGAFVGTALVAGAQIFLPVPAYELVAPAMGVPRFYRFVYTVSGSATASFTAGILLDPNRGYVGTQYGKSFSVA